MATPAFKVGVWETATVTGTGTVTLSGTAKAGPYQNFSGIASGSLVPYRIQDNTTYAWEVGWGIYTVTTSPAGTLSRNVIESSNSGSLVSFAGNSCDVTLEIISPVITSGGSTSAGLLAALNANGVFDASFLTNALSSTYLTPINNSSASSDLSLGVGQKAFITVSNATSVPLHIACGDNQEYRITFQLSAGLTMYLQPNNTTYSGAFNYIQLFGYSGGAGGNAGTASSMLIALNGTGANYKVISFISTKTTSKAIISPAVTAGYYVFYYGCYWADTTTVWSSLGTVTATTGMTGQIIIERVA